MLVAMALLMLAQAGLTVSNVFAFKKYWSRILQDFFFFLPDHLKNRLCRKPFETLQDSLTSTLLFFLASLSRCVYDPQAVHGFDKHKPHSYIVFIFA